MKFALARYIKSVFPLESPDQVIGIYSVNRYECMIAEYATYMLGRFTCPIYNTSVREHVRLIMNETDMKICFVTIDRAEFLYESGLLSEVPLKDVFLFGDDFRYSEEFERRGVKIHYFCDIIKRAKPVKVAEGSNLHEAALGLIRAIGLRLPGPDSTATICYTSGTTGIPKGAVLTHSNFVGMIESLETNRDFFQVRAEDVYISYLPLSHVLEKAVVNSVMSRGASIGFASGTREKLSEDIRKIRPTLFAAVPKILDRICKRVRAEIGKKGHLATTMFNLETKGVLGSFLRRLSLDFVSKKVRQEFGGRIRACMSGGAFLRPELCLEAQRVLGCRVFQGYGQTETTGTVCLRPWNCTEVDTVGVPIPCNEVKLVPGEAGAEMYVRGRTVFKGYYKNEALTREVFEDGWFKTGDIAVCERGMYRITGRARDTFKVSNGEFISPETLEELLVVDGASDVLVLAAEDDGIDLIVFGDSESLVEDARRRAQALLSTGRIRGYEVPKRIRLVRRDIGAFYTPTAKKQRSRLVEELRRTGDL